MDLDIPPAQDSPAHILNALNDDCIQSTLRRVNNIRDFQSAAETCVRFEENAKLAFRSQYKFVRIGRPCGDERRNRHTVVDRQHSFLSSFGHLITELHYHIEINDEITNMIADYCGKTLKIFKCGDLKSGRYSLVDFGTRFPALEELEIRNITVHNFKYYSQLKKLTVKGGEVQNMKFDWLIQAFPKLECVDLQVLNDLQHDQAVELLKLNPQLIGVAFGFCDRIKSIILVDLAYLLPNLEKLGFVARIIKFYHAMYISTLRSLKSLILKSAYSIYVEQFVDSLIANNIPIESLLLIDLFSSDLGLSRFKRLRKLYDSMTTDDRLNEYIKNLPELELLVCEFSRISLNGIKTALQNATFLSVLVVEITTDELTEDEITIGLDDYTSILNLAKSRGIQVSIFISSGTINVPTEVLEQNSRHLYVKKDEHNSIRLYTSFSVRNDNFFIMKYTEWLDNEFYDC